MKQLEASQIDEVRTLLRAHGIKHRDGRTADQMSDQEIVAALATLERAFSRFASALNVQFESMAQAMVKVGAIMRKHGLLDA